MYGRDVKGIKPLRFKTASRYFFTFLSLILLLSASLPSVFSQNYIVGVEVGDWAEYEQFDYFGAYVGSFRITITEISDTNVKYSMDYIDGENPSLLCPYPWIDVKSTCWVDPFEYWGHYSIIIASGIEEGEKVYGCEGAPVMGEVSNVFVAGAVREVGNLWISESPYGGSSGYHFDLFYDKMTGMMVNMTFRARGLNYEQRMVNTNMYFTATCSISQPEVILGNSVTVSGAITPPVSEKTIILTYQKPDGSSSVRPIMTAQDGTYNDTYNPDMEGAWSVHASWEGEENYTGCTSPLTLFTVHAKPFYEETWVYLMILITSLSVSLYIRTRNKSKK